MEYNLIKSFHIISGSLFFVSAGLITYWWFAKKTHHNLDKLMWFVMMPSGLIQLITGFAIIGIQQYDYHNIWVMGSIIGFVLQILGWYSWLWIFSRYQLLQAIPNTRDYSSAYRWILNLLSLSLMVVLFIMVFLMTIPSVNP